MVTIKQTPLKKTRQFKVLPGYVVHMENKIYNPEDVILASTEEMLNGIMSQVWKVVEVVVPEAKTTPVVEAEVHEKPVAKEVPQEEPNTSEPTKGQRPRRSR